MSTLIIAEAGVNHDGNIERARELVGIATAAGADIVKFQTFSADKSISGSAPKAAYQRRSTGSESQYEMVKKLELDRAAHRTLREDCDRSGIEFFSTAFDEESVDLLIELGVKRLKVASGEITNLPLLRHIGSQGLPVLLSTGMATLGEVEAALLALERAGMASDRVILLHCNTEYPTPMVDANLRAIETLRAAFGLAVGYSDHTAGIEVPIAAVALGATVIEKHFTIDRTLPGPDHAASLEPAELAAMVCAIRNIEQALGDGRKRPTRSEQPNIKVARKSIVAGRAIRAGEVLSNSNLATKRPGTGLSPMRWDEIVGRPAPRDFSADEPIEL